MSYIKNKNKKKLHVCCGDIYLLDYINIDIKGIIVKNKFCYNHNLTTLDKYYKFPFGSEPREFIIDEQMDILLPWCFKDESVDEVLMISAIEHFTLAEAEYIIKQAFYVLKHGGVLKIDFPDLVKGVDDYSFGKCTWEELMQLIYCNNKNKYSEHKYGYIKTTFKELLERAGRDWKSIVFKDIVKHSYPMIGCEAVKL